MTIHAIVTERSRVSEALVTFTWNYFVEVEVRSDWVDSGRRQVSLGGDVMW
jgi:hypothetical protein